MECRSARRDKSVSQNNVEIHGLGERPRVDFDAKVPSHKSFAMV
jgi:hypothetical protein